MLHGEEGLQRRRALIQCRRSVLRAADIRRRRRSSRDLVVGSHDRSRESGWKLKVKGVVAVEWQVQGVLGIRRLEEGKLESNRHFSKAVADQLFRRGLQLTWGIIRRKKLFVTII